MQFHDNVPKSELLKVPPPPPTHKHPLQFLHGYIGPSAQKHVTLRFQIFAVFFLFFGGSDTKNDGAGNISLCLKTKKNCD